MFSKNSNFFLKCDSCNYICSKKQHFNQHCSTDKHKRLIMANKNSNKNSENINDDSYYCISCDYKCSKKHHYNQHCLTTKHLLTINSEKIVKKVKNSSHQLPSYICDDCNKRYLHLSSLYKHKKKCFKNENIIDLLQKNQEFLKEIIAEQNKNISEIIKNQQVSTNTTNNIITTNNKNTFNLQIFLNEKCKDAMNINEFLDSIKYKVSDIENFADYGYVESMSKLFINNLKLLSIYKRPIHCSDVKREILYIKDADDKWEKDENKTKIIKAIKKVDFNNIKNIEQWKKMNPHFHDIENKQNETYNKIIMESMSGEDPLYDKIVTNISKNVIIDKTS